MRKGLLTTKKKNFLVDKMGKIDTENGVLCQISVRSGMTRFKGSYLMSQTWE